MEPGDCGSAPARKEDTMRMLNSPIFVGSIDIQTGEMLEGDLPRRALKIVQEWAEQHRSELLTMWDTQQITVLPPLE